MKQRNLEILDSETGLRHCLRLNDGFVAAVDLRQIRAQADDTGLLVYDPSLSNTAWCRSGITMLDEQHEVLSYRGYAIDELVGTCRYTEVAHLLVDGELPNSSQLLRFEEKIAASANVNTRVFTLIGSFPADARPASVLIGALAAMDDGRRVVAEQNDGKTAGDQEVELIARLPVIVAGIYRHLRRQPPRPFEWRSGYVESLLAALFGDVHPGRDPVLAEVLERLFILQADHEQNCGTTAVRTVTSSGANTFMSILAGVAALSGPLHGGASEQVVGMLQAIGSKERVGNYIAKAKLGDVPLVGFGHRVYRSCDPRARILKAEAQKVLDHLNGNALIEIALALERAVTEDDVMRERGLFPTIELFAGPLYSALSIPRNMFALLFAIPRLSGWLANRREFLEDDEQLMVRPRQIYCGQPPRQVRPIRMR